MLASHLCSAVMVIHSTWAPYTAHGYHTQHMGTTHSTWARHTAHGHHTQHMGTTHSTWARHTAHGHHTQHMGTTHSTWAPHTAHGHHTQHMGTTHSTFLEGHMPLLIMSERSRVTVTGEADDPAAPYLVGNLSVSMLACRDTAMSV